MTARGMDVTLLYFPGCPNWQLVEDRLALVAAERGDITVTHQLVDTVAKAERLGFFGSPSIHVNGVDLFAEPGLQVALSRRRYLSPHGYVGAPTLEQLRAVLA